MPAPPPPRAMMEAIWVPASLLPGFCTQGTQTGPDSAETRFADTPAMAPLRITLDAQGGPVEVVPLRWSDADPKGSYRLHPFGGRMLSTAVHHGFRIPVRVVLGNLYGTAEHAPFFRATISHAAF